MNQSRVWTIGAVFLVVLLLAGTWLLGVAPRLSDAADSDAARQQAIALNNVHRQTLAELQAEHERLDEILDEIEEAHSVIPELPDVSTLLASMGELAQKSGATVREFSVSVPFAYEPPGDAAADYLVAATELASNGLYVIDITIMATGSDAALLNFIAELQAGQRLMVVHDAQLVGEGDEPPSVTIRAQIFGLSAATLDEPEPTAPPAPQQ